MQINSILNTPKYRGIISEFNERYKDTIIEHRLDDIETILSKRISEIKPNNIYDNNSYIARIEGILDNETIPDLYLRYELYSKYSSDEVNVIKLLLNKNNSNLVLNRPDILEKQHSLIEAIFEISKFIASSIREQYDLPLGLVIETIKSNMGKSFNFINQLSSRLDNLGVGYVTSHQIIFQELYGDSWWDFQQIFTILLAYSLYLALPDKQLIEVGNKVLKDYNLSDIHLDTKAEFIKALPVRLLLTLLKYDFSDKSYWPYEPNLSKLIIGKFKSIKLGSYSAFNKVRMIGLGDTVYNQTEYKTILYKILLETCLTQT